MLKVGLVTRERTPRRGDALNEWVLPAPRSPEQHDDVARMQIGSERRGELLGSLDGGGFAQYVSPLAMRP